MSASTNIPLPDSVVSSSPPATGCPQAAASHSPSAACVAPSRRGSCFPKPPVGQPETAGVDAEQRIQEVADGLALLASQPKRGGRPTVVDEQLKGKIVILLATGLSLRQTAAFLGITHPTVSAAIAGDQALAADLADARVRAEVHPLNRLIREGGRSWHAAAWLLTYLQKQNERERQSEADQKMKNRPPEPDHARQASRPPPAPMSSASQARIAAIRSQRPRRKRGRK